MFLQGNVFSGESPAQHGVRASEDGFDIFFGVFLSSLLLPHSHRDVTSADISLDDGGTNAPGALTLDPALVSETLSVHFGGELLHHIGSLRFAMHGHINPYFVLPLDAFLNVVLLVPPAFLAGDSAFVEIVAYLAELRGLRVRTDGSCGEIRQLGLFWASGSLVFTSVEHILCEGVSQIGRFSALDLILTLSRSDVHEVLDLLQRERQSILDFVS